MIVMRMLYPYNDLFLLDLGMPMTYVSKKKGISMSCHFCVPYVASVLNS